MDALDKALDKYLEKFDENYPILITDTRSDEEIIKRINYCIENNIKEAEPEYEEGCDY